MSAEQLRFDKEKWSQLLNPVCQLWQTIYKHQDFASIKISQGQLGSADPIESFVYMEMDYIIKILEDVHESITYLMKVLQGQATLTPNTEKVATALLKGDTPPAWIRKWDGPEAPIPWLRSAVIKANALRGWLQKQQQKSLMNSSLDLSNLFHPETFLNALRQRSARQLKTAIDDLKLVSSFEQSKVSNAAKLEGMWLQGCELNGGYLSDSRQAQELVPVPPCFVAWIKKSDPEPHGGQTIPVPVYHSLDREKLLCTLSVPNQGDEPSRVIAGVALFLNGSD